VKRLLVDTGPLVAILSPDDEYHQTCAEALRRMPVPLLSCWPVITEAAWLLRKSPRAMQELLRLVSGGLVDLLPLKAGEISSIAALLKRHSDMQPELADATLVYLAEREQIDTIFSLDRRDFSVYRLGRKRVFQIIPE